MSTPERSVTRREFVKASAVLAAAAVPATGLAAGLTGNFFHAAGSDTIKLGLIGCGGRGTGAAGDSLNASPNIKLVAMADVFRDRLDGCRQNLLTDDYTKPFADRAKVSDDRCYVGFDAYKQLLSSDVDMVILATPPHFRPIHFAAAIDAGKHVFFEKPVAVDGQGIRAVLAAGELAAKKKLGVVAGTQRRHQDSYLECMKRLRDGAIGKIVSARCYWNQGGLWNNGRKPEWTDMEWQLRNWLYFAWLSGDHIVEQHVHNLDVCNWAIGSHPLKASGLGGRQVRTSPEYGHVFDHFSVEYEYAGGVVMHSSCRQIDGCDGRVEEHIVGSEGTLIATSGAGAITGKSPWRYSNETAISPYQQEHKDLVKSILAGTPLNEAKNVAESTLTAIMGRLSTYSGKTVTWEQALNSNVRLGPKEYALGPLPVDAVAVPGRTNVL